VPDKTGCAKTRRWTAELPAVDARRTMVGPRHADAAPAERCRAVQARTAEEIDAPGRLSQMPAQLLRKNSIDPPGGAEGRSAVVLACGIERSLRGKAWYRHPTTPGRRNEKSMADGCRGLLCNRLAGSNNGFVRNP
jgi:hypothetical protein